MAEDLLDRVLREVSERKKRAQAAWEESRRLEAALRALEGESPLAEDQPVDTANEPPRREPDAPTTGGATAVER